MASWVIFEDTEPLLYVDEAQTQGRALEIAEEYKSKPNAELQAVRSLENTRVLPCNMRHLRGDYGE